MRVAVDKSFSPSFPYSKIMVATLNYAGPIFESKWEYFNYYKPP